MLFFVSSLQMLYETIDDMFMVTPLRFELRIFAVKERCVYRFHYGAIQPAQMFVSGGAGFFFFAAMAIDT